MIERLDSIETRYLELTNLLMSESMIGKIGDTLKLTKEKASLEEAYNCYMEYKKILDSILDVQEMMKDAEMYEMAKEELEGLTNKKVLLEQELETLLLPKDPNDGKDVIIEIRGAAGGDEANLFASDLFRMYAKYIERQGWKYELLNEEKKEGGGSSQIEFKVKGKNVYSKLKYESGAHRVQRVPETETQGRIHTSIATVLVMPEAEDLEVEIRNEDIRVDIFRSGGKGGQGVNTTDSAVRITHLPSNIVVTCQNERSQIQNKESCMQMLKTRLYEKELREKEEQEGADRKNKIGSGDRSEKIRTYNYPQNRVTDHRIGLTIKQLDRIMEGALDEIIEALVAEDQKRLIKGE